MFREIFITWNQLIELSADKTSQLELSCKELDKFQLAGRNECPKLVKEDSKIIPLAALYLCEIGLSSMTAIKTKTGQWPIFVERFAFTCLYYKTTH
jgi:hypothetical protein